MIVFFIISCEIYEKITNRYDYTETKLHLEMAEI